MKSRKLLPVFGAMIAFSMHAHAAPVVKSATGTDLNDGASWGGATPASTDVATWQPASLGAALTLSSAADWEGISVSGALTNIDVSGAGLLTLGSGGIDMSATAVNATFGNPISLGAQQTWKVATGKTLGVSGTITGTEGLTVGQIAPSVRHSAFLSLAATPVFLNTSLASVTGISGEMGGGWVNSNVPMAANVFFFTNNGTTASCQFQIVDGGFLKCVKVELTQVGPDIAARTVYAKYHGTPGDIGLNFDTAGIGGTVATAKFAGGYGAESTTLLFGTSSLGVVTLSGANTFSGPLSVSTNLKAGVASVPGVSGPFGLNAPVIMDTATGSTLDLNGFNVAIGSITGGTAASGNVVLGSSRLTFGGDNTSPAPYAGRITGTGGIVKVGSGVQVFSTSSQTMTGGVTVEEGTLSLVGNAGFDGGFFSNTQTFTVNEGGVLEYNGDWITKANNIYNINGGTLAMTKSTGDLTINYINNLNLTNGFTIGSGSYRIGNNTNATHTFSGDEGNVVATGFGLVKNGAIQTINLVVNDGLEDADLTVSGVIYDVGGLTGSNLVKQGAGKMILTANNTYNGPTNITSGTLQIGDGGSNGSFGTGSVINDSVLIFDRANDFAFPNTLSGAGSLVKNGEGTLTLSGTKSHTGNTIVNAGRLSVTSAMTSSPVTVNSGGTLSGNSLLGAVTVNAGGTIEAGVNGVGDLLPDTLNLETGAIINVVPGAGIVDAVTLNINGATTINVTDGGREVGSYPLIRYGSYTGTGLNIGTLPPRVTANIADNSGSTVWELNITEVDRPRWTGAASGVWDTLAINWKEIGSGDPTAYIETDDVLFDDLATGTTDITLDGFVAPNTVTFDNSVAKDYSITGIGSIDGETGITKINTGLVTIETLNTFTGPVAINGGVLAASSIENSGVSSSLGMGTALSFDGGTLDFTGLFGVTNRTVAFNSGGASIRTDEALLLTGAISGPGALLKSGTGDLELNAANSFSGGITVSSGWLSTNANTGFGTGTITLGDENSGSEDISLYLTSRADVTNPIIVNASGTGTVTIGADNSGGGANAASFLGPVTLNRAVTMSGEVFADRLTFDGQISGAPGTITITGGSRVTFVSTANDFTGNIVISGEGTIFQATAGTIAEVIPNDTSVTVGLGTIFQLAASGGGAETIGGLSGEGTVRTFPTAGFGSNLIVGSVDSSGNFSGSLIDGFNALSLTKIGTGIQITDGVNTYTGPTLASAGVLGGTGSAGSDFTVQDTATLAPGDGGIGILLTKSVTLATGSTLAIEIDSTSGSADRVTSSGNVTLTDATLDLSEIGSGPLAPGTELVILDYTGFTLTGTFDGLPDGGSVTVGGNSFTIAYNDASQVVLTAGAAGGFATWADDNAPTQTIDMDHDGDGVPNGIEYFMGLNGSAFTTTPGLAANGSITWPKGAGYTGDYGTDYVVETSSDLEDWAPVAVGDVVIGGTTLTYTLDSELAPIFVRLKVTGP